VESGIFSFRKLSGGLLSASVDGVEAMDGNLSAEFEKFLKALIEEIFNPDIPFTQTPEVKTCTYCGFKGICFR
jgi:hypothetical protein